MVKRIWSTAVTQTTSTPVEGDLGQLRWEGSACYRYVQNRHNAALSVGDVVVGRTGDTTTGEVYRNGSTDTTASQIRGVAVSAIPADHYGWVLCLGRVNANVNAATAIAVGQALTPGANTFRAVASSTTPAGGHLVALQAVASGDANIPVLVKAL